MSLPLVAPRFEAADYLAWEAEQAVKHEYLDGEVFAMAGASEAHVTIAGNMYMALRNHLRGGPCSVFISDMKLHVAQGPGLLLPGCLRHLRRVRPRPNALQVRAGAGHRSAVLQH